MRSARLLGIVLVAAGESAPRIGGPYEDIGVAMRPGPDSLPWEGPQGTDSFFPWRVGGRWRAFYGSARTETKPIGHWLVGPAEARLSPAPRPRTRGREPLHAGGSSGPGRRSPSDSVRP